jgi:ATP-dependent helicase HepA
VNSEFFPGQRWVSNTESELGLGIVVMVEDRRVELSFPAAGERRTYAFNNAPLSRVIYHVGEPIRNEEGQQLTITEVHDHQGCKIYMTENAEGDEVTVPELDLDSFVQFSKPQDRLFAGQIDKNRAFELRCQTLSHVNHLQQTSVTGLLGPRVQLLPHQLYIAHEVANRFAPRVLLADEVGLGKTIEAGLVIHQQLISSRAQRVLIVVPDSLLHQWLVEMLRRFNLSFTILDEERCQALDTSAEGNPFDSAQLVLCKLSLFTEQEARLQQAAVADWDLLVVDEAHHLEWSHETVSPAYSAIEILARRAKGLLLLTATPEQLGIESHFARLRLLDPDRYFDLDAFCDEEARYQPVNNMIQQLLDEHAEQQLREQPELLEQLRSYLGDEEIDRLQTLLKTDEKLDRVIEALVRDILDRHGTGRVLFRNTRSSVTGFPERCLHQYPLEAPEQYLQRQEQATAIEKIQPEQVLGEQWWQDDSRVAWLVKWLREHREDKVLVICANAETALDLEAYLRLRQGCHSSVFHEGLSLLERDRAAAYFSDEEEGAQVLICSEIGSEGRNFQFANHLVLFDLPLNPDLLEQRIGRLDRIGQRNTVNLHVPFYEHSAQAVLLEWYHRGVNAFEQTCPAGQNLFNEFEQQLLVCMQDSGDDAAIEKLVSETNNKLLETLDIMQQGRDRLLELNSCDAAAAEKLVTEMQAVERDEELSDYMEQVFDQFGVEQEHHSANSIILRPGDHMIGHTFPALNEEGMTATFNREVALSRDDINYLTWEHPMVNGAMDMVLSGDFGNTAFCTLKLPPLKPGTLLLEAIFTVHCSAPAHLQLSRYLPLTTIRVVVTNDGKDLSKVLTQQHINQLRQKIAKRNAQEMIKHARDTISEVIGKAEKIASPQLQALAENAATQMQSVQQAEIKRMQSLRNSNPNIREEEIDYLLSVTESMQDYIDGAQLKLDAIRIGVVVN